MKKFSFVILGALMLIQGCIKVDGSLGKGLIDKSLIYETYTVEFPLREIEMKRSAELSGYSSTRLVIGAIRDDVFGLTTRETALTLVPALDTLDFGVNPLAVSMNIYFAADSISCADDSQARIIQNFKVTELLEPLGVGVKKAQTEVSHGTQSISDGTPVYNGSGPLQFNFTKAFAQKYVDAIKGFAPDGEIVSRNWDTDKMEERFTEYTKAAPGIHIQCYPPEGNGGRLNLFQLSCLSVSNNYYQRNNNVCYLKVNSTWDGVKKDSTFMFIPGEMEFTDEASYLKQNTKFTQYTFNRTTHEKAEGPATSALYVEGGTGVKPVISAQEIQRNVVDSIAKYGGDPDKAIITKATLILPFEKPADYLDFRYFPGVLSPTILNTKTVDGKETKSYDGLTDASVSTENQGDVDRANLMYCPDITYHVQEILLRKDLATSTNADIWLLTLHTEKTENANGLLYDNSYYQNLLYANYYNNLYGGGYGYGSYGYNSYSNYYSYMMLAQLLNSSQQQTFSYTAELDQDRYYRAVLNGMDSSNPPMFRVTFAITKE